jgi:hypothetical protein
MPVNENMPVERRKSEVTKLIARVLFDENLIIESYPAELVLQTCLPIAEKSFFMESFSFSQSIGLFRMHGITSPVADRTCGNWTNCNLSEDLRVFFFITRKQRLADFCETAAFQLLFERLITVFVIDRQSSQSFWRIDFHL